MSSGATARLGATAGNLASAPSPLEQRGDVGCGGMMLSPSRQSRGFAPARQQAVDGAGQEGRGSVLPGAATVGMQPLTASHQSQWCQCAVPRHRHGERGGCQQPAGTGQRTGFAGSGGSCPCGSASACKPRRACPVPLPGAALPGAAAEPSRAAGAEGPWADAGAAADWAPSRSRQRPE